MADYHIREQDLDKKTIRIVCHIPVPDTGNNEAVIQWRTALVKHLGGAANITSVLPEVQGQAEETNMKAGAVYEIAKNCRFSKLGLTIAEKKMEIATWYNSIKSSILSDLQIQLEYIGFESP